MLSVRAVADPRDGLERGAISVPLDDVEHAQRLGDRARIVILAQEPQVAVALLVDERAEGLRGPMGDRVHRRSP